MRRRDDQDVSNPRQHQRRQRVVHHRLVVDRHELLADRPRQRMQPRPRAAGEDDAFQSFTPWLQALARLSRIAVARRSALASHQSRCSRYQRAVDSSPSRRNGGAPSRARGDLRCVDGVAAIVAGPVLHKRLQRAIAARPRNAGFEAAGTKPRGRRTSDRRSRTFVSSLLPPILYFSPGAPFSEREQQARHSDLDVQPVANIARRRRRWAAAVPRSRSESSAGSAFPETDAGRSCSSSS